VVMVSDALFDKWEVLKLMVHQVILIPSLTVVLKKIWRAGATEHYCLRMSTTLMTTEVALKYNNLTLEWEVCIIEYDVFLHCLDYSAFDRWYGGIA
jgi:hypothetical protein